MRRADALLRRLAEHERAADNIVLVVPEPSALLPIFLMLARIGLEAAERGPRQLAS
jgi:hypothetical protein